MKKIAMRVWLTIVHFLVLLLAVVLYRATIYDVGHRTFGIPNEQARAAILEAFQKVGGLEEYATFDFENTHQTVLSDFKTVLISLDQSPGQAVLPLNSISIPVRDMKASLRETSERYAQTLRGKGFAAYVHTLNSDQLVAVESAAFLNWVTIFRRDTGHMPKPHWRQK